MLHERRQRAQASIFSHMARGQRWPKQNVDQWVEQWWRSQLTSSQFVSAGALPISARALRWHGQRHLSEVLSELQELRALVGCRVASRDLPSSAPTPATDHFIFDLGDMESKDPGALIEAGQMANLPEAGVAGPPALRESDGQMAKAAAVTASDGATAGQVANSHQVLVPAPSQTPDCAGQMATQPSLPTRQGPFFFDEDD